jgi:methylenetetrahydrofolate reductase (NADPH)
VSKLLVPFTPEDVLSDLAAYKASNPGFLVERVHFFPLGGIGKTAEFTAEYGAVPAARASA